MNTGAMFLVSSDVGNLLCMLDEATLHNVIFYDDAFANSIKDIYELPNVDHIKKDVMIFRTDISVKWFFSVLKSNHIVKEEDEHILSFILDKMQKKDCCLIYHR